MVELAAGTNPVFLTRFTGFQRTQATEFPFNRNADCMRHFNHFGGHFDVVGIGGRRFSIGPQRTIHHHAGKTATHGLLANRRRRGVI